MASHAPQRPSIRIGLVALLLGVIVISLLGSLAAADRALQNADRRAARLDARGVALDAERELRLHAERLSEMFDPLLLPASMAATARMAPPGVPDFTAVWVMDSIGRVAWARDSAAAPGVSASHLSRASAAADARGPSSAGWGTTPVVHAIPPTGASEGGVLLSVALTHQGVRLGTAAAFIPASRLLERVRDDSATRPVVSLLAGVAASRESADTGAVAVTEDTSVIGAVGDTVLRRGLITADAPLGLPGDPVVLRVTHAQVGRDVRTVLWLVGAVGLATLLVALARERRQAANLAARTAELERLYQEVARSNRMKSEFLANVSHELRTPLNAIVGFVEMLREGVYGELTPRQALPAERIAASATHLRQLVDRLLDIARIAAGRVEVNPESIVLRPFVLNVASEMESLITERGLALTVDVSPTLPRVRTDQTHLRQILINMIGNAVKYTPSGEIRVHARLAGEGVAPDASADAGHDTPAAPPPDPQRRWIALHVTDTGIGIAGKDLERIFDEFEQVNAGARTDSVSRGTGLGLAISRRLARLLGGDLTVVSEPQRGSTFTLWLPIEAQREAAEAA